MGTEDGVVAVLPPRQAPGKSGGAVAVGKGPPGKGKGPPKPPPHGKGKAPPVCPAGDVAPCSSPDQVLNELPSWQAPQLSSDWQTERVVNWQPIRQRQRLSGSVWQQVHDSIGSGGVAPPPDSLLSRFMRKASDTCEKQNSNGTQKRAHNRLLARQAGLIADINHALLTRKGVHSPRQLQWAIGYSDSSPVSSGAPVEEDVLEALLGLFGAAVGQEQRLSQPDRPHGEDSVPARSEAFLRRLLTEVAPLTVLQARAEMVLIVFRFPARVADLKEELRTVLSAVWSVMGSKTIPVLLEGLLWLGNYVNAASKHLGAALGVSLESLTKLANTQCLPLESSSKKRNGRGSRRENALDVLVQHLEQTRPEFSKELASDLDGCHAVRDVDQTALAAVAQELLDQVRRGKQRLASHDGPPKGEPDTLSADRLRSFLADADVHMQEIQELLADMEDATAGLRQWFAEPPTTTLREMLKQLAALRDALPIPKAAAAKVVERPPEQMQHRRSSLLEPAPGGGKSEAQQKIRHEPMQPKPAAVGSDALSSVAPPSEPELEPIPDMGSPSHRNGAVCALCAHDDSMAPYGVVVQILSFCSGTLWISWLFDWDSLPSEQCQIGGVGRSFEVVQLAATPSNAGENGQLGLERVVARWPCQRPPLKIDVPLGHHYTFQVQAMLTETCSSPTYPGQAESRRVWVSAFSPPIVADLRRSAGSFGARQGPRNSHRRPMGVAERLATADLTAASSHIAGDRGGPQPAPERKRRVAAGLDAFLTGLQADAATGSGQQPPARQVDEDADDDPAGKNAVHENLDAGTAGTGASVPPMRSDPDPSSPSAVNSPPMSDGGTDAIGSLAESDLDQESDETLRQLARALSFFESRAASTTGYADGVKPDGGGEVKAPETIAIGGGSRGPVSARPSTAQPITTLSTKQDSPPALPRGESIFDDDSLQLIAKALGHLEKAISPDGESIAAGTLGEVTSLAAPPDSGGCRPSEVTGLSAGLSTRQNAFVAEDVVDGNEVIAAIEQEYKRRSCRSCGGTGFRGVFGTRGLGLMQVSCKDCGTESHPCEASSSTASLTERSSVLEQKGIAAETAAVRSVASTAPLSLSQPAEPAASTVAARSAAIERRAPAGGSATTVPVGRGTSDAGSLPFLAAPFWAAPTRAPSTPVIPLSAPDVLFSPAAESELTCSPGSCITPGRAEGASSPNSGFKLSVELQSGRRNLEFNTDSDLAELVRNFVQSNRLLDIFAEPLLARVTQMLSTGTREEHVDVVDLL